MDLLPVVEGEIRRALSDHPDRSILVAVSGGPDSVALLDLLARLRRRLDLKLGVAHVNYRLRPEDSDEDALFARALAQSYGLPFALRELSSEETARVEGRGMPVRARDLRLSFLEQVRSRDSYRLVALGHHRDDQVETFFSHLFRGAGPAGIKGMTVVSPAHLFRPLLTRTKAEILTYLQRRHLPFRIDRSNDDPAYERNRIRSSLIPLVCAQFGQAAIAAIARTMDLTAAESDLLDRLAQRELSLVTHATDDGAIGLELARFSRLPRALQRRVVRQVLSLALGGRAAPASLTDALVSLATEGKSGSVLDLGRGVRAVRSFGRVVVGGPSPVADPITQVELAPGSSMTVPEWGLVIDVSEQPAEGAGPFTPGIFQGDRQKIRFPLFVRRARAGDRIRPLGMGGHAKKLTRYLMDLKVPATERARQLVLAERDRVLWVVGRAVAEDCRIVPSTRSILRVRVTKMEGQIGEPTRA